MQKEKDTIEFVETSPETAFEEMKNRRDFLKKVMKPAEKAKDELEKVTATEKVRLQGTKEPKIPTLKPYTESVDVKDRHELGKLISEAKANNTKWLVKRCSEEKLSEGYRYTFFSTKEAVNEDVSIQVTADEVKIADSTGEEVGIIPISAEEQGIEEEEPVMEAAEEEVEVTPPAYTVGKFMDELKDFDKEMSFEWKPLIVDDKEYQITAITFDNPEEGKIVASVNFVPVEKPEEISAEEEPVDLLAAPEETEIVVDEEKKLCEDKEELKAERDALWAKMPDCTADEVQRLMDIRDELGADEFYTESITEEALAEASSAEKRAYRNGGYDTLDLDFGKALARIKDPHERAMLLHQHKLEKSGKKMSDRAPVAQTLDRKLNQAKAANDKKMAVMQKAGFDADKEVAEEQPLEEAAKISLDDLTLFKPWGGAKDTWELILAQEKLEALDKALEDMYPDGIKASELNDILWFEKDWIFDTLELEPKKPFEIRDDAIEAEVAEVGPAPEKAEA